MTAVDHTDLIPAMSWPDEGQHPVYDTYLDDIRAQLANEWAEHQADVAAGRSDPCTFNDWFTTEGANRPEPIIDYLGRLDLAERTQHQANRWDR